MATIAQHGQHRSLEYRRWLIAQWRDGLGLAVTLFVFLRLAFSLFAATEAALLPLDPPCTAATPASKLHSEGLAFSLLGVWQRADGCAYETIASEGYQPTVIHRLAFFPLYPLLLRLISPLAGNSFTLAGMIVSGSAFIAAVTGLYRLVCREFDTQVARRAILYLSAFPTVFFLFAPFTESLFLALSIWTLYAARQRLWVWAGLLGFLAALTRSQGVLLVLPLLWEGWQHHRANDRPRIPPWHSFTALLGPLCGFLLYNGYTIAFAGHNVLQIQRRWGMTSAPPWTVLTDSLNFVIARNSPVEAINLVLIVVCSFLAIVGIVKLPFSYTLIAAPQLLVLLTREMYLSPLMSVSRLLIVIFPVFIVLALLGRRPWLHRAWLCLSLVLLAALFLIFIGGPFVA